MSDSVPIAVRVLLLGAEGSGKTTLTQQLKCLGSSLEAAAVSKKGGRSTGPVPLETWRMLEGGSIPIAPTTGQEVETVSLPIPTCQLNTEGRESIRQHQQQGKKKVPQAGGGDYSDAEGDNDDAYYNDGNENRRHSLRANIHNDNIGGVTEDRDDDDHRRLLEDQRHSLQRRPNPPPPPSPRHGGSASTSEHRTTKDTSTMVAANIKEIGGRMIAVWPRFIKKSHDDPTTVGSGGPASAGAGGPALAKKALIYVIDMANPSLLPLASIELSGILGNTEQVGSGHWSVLVLLNKVGGPSTMSLGMVLSTLGIMHEAPEVVSWRQQVLDSSSGTQGCRLRLSDTVSLMTVDTWSGHGLVEVFDWIRGLAYSA